MNEEFINKRQSLSIKQYKELSAYKKLFILVLLIILVWSLGFFAKFIISRNIVVISDEYSMVYNIDYISFQDDIVLEGWAFDSQKDAQLGNIQVVLYNEVTNEFLFPKMEYMERQDVNNYYQNGFNYSLSGIKASIKSSKLDLEHYDYKILFCNRDKYVRSANDSGLYLCRSGITHVSTSEQKEISFDNESDTWEFLSSGEIMVCRNDLGVYLYLKEDNVYMVLDKSYPYFQNEDTYVEFQLDTTQTDLLPQFRLEHGWLWDNIGFVFSEKEIKEYETEHYRVAKIELPEYAITHIWIGYYNMDWIWREDFRVVVLR